MTLPALLCLSACAPTTDAGLGADGLVSTSLCGDAYARHAARASGVSLAALSWQSAGPLGSGWTGPRASSDPERLVALQPDILLLGPGERVRADLLPGTRIVALDWAEDWAGVEANLDKVKARIPGSRDADPSRPRPPGSSPRIGLDATEPRVAASTRPSLLYLTRSGSTAGPGTYVDAAMRAAGARNLVATPGWSTPDPEWLLAQDPDIILTSFFDSYESVNARAARHRALRNFIAARPRIDIPGRLWPCASPDFADVVELIRQGVRG